MSIKIKGITMEINLQADSLAGLFNAEPEELMDLMEDSQRVTCLVSLAAFLSNDENSANVAMISTSMAIGENLYTVNALLDYWNKNLSDEELVRLTILFND